MSTRDAQLVSLLQSFTTIAGIALALMAVLPAMGSSPAVRGAVFVAGTASLLGAVRSLRELIEIQAAGPLVGWGLWIKLIRSSGVESIMCIALLVLAFAFLLIQVPMIGVFMADVLSWIGASFRPAE